MRGLPVLARSALAAGNALAAVSEGWALAALRRGPGAAMGSTGGGGGAAAAAVGATWAPWRSLTQVRCCVAAWRTAGRGVQVCRQARRGSSEYSGGHSCAAPRSRSSLATTASLCPPSPPFHHSFLCALCSTPVRTRRTLIMPTPTPTGPMMPPRTKCARLGRCRRRRAGQRQRRRHMPARRARLRPACR